MTLKKTKTRCSDANLILRCVADHFGQKQSELKGLRRHSRFVAPRHLAMFLMRENAGMTFEDIGVIFSWRDHSSVLHAVKTTRGCIACDPNLARSVEIINREIIQQSVATESEIESRMNDEAVANLLCHA